MFPYNHITIIVEGVDVKDMALAPEVEPEESEKPPDDNDKKAAGTRKRQRKAAVTTVVLNAYKTLPRDVNPFTTPIVVDMKASERYSSHKLNQIMTITATRASQRGYWCSIKGAVLNIDEMAKCQGWYPENFPWREAGLKEAAAGHCIGNSQTLPLVQDVLAHLLFHGSVINYQQFLAMKTAV